MANIIKVTTATMLFWSVDGMVTICKCKKTGRFINRENAQMIIDNMILLACNVAEYQLNTGKIASSSLKDFVEFNKTVFFYDVTVYKPLFDGWTKQACAVNACASQMPNLLSGMLAAA